MGSVLDVIADSCSSVDSMSELASAPTTAATRARYRRILRFAARYIVQTWWYELVLPRVGFAKVVARG